MKGRDSNAPCRVEAAEGGTLRWTPLRSVEADDTQITVLVEEPCGDPVVEGLSAVTLGEDSVIVTISGRYLEDDEWGNCAPSAREILVDIGEPIGERDLFNGNVPPSKTSRRVSEDPRSWFVKSSAL